MVSDLKAQSASLLDNEVLKAAENPAQPIGVAAGLRPRKSERRIDKALALGPNPSFWPEPNSKRLFHTLPLDTPDKIENREQCGEQPDPHPKRRS